jgi:hypothetical protein
MLTITTPAQSFDLTVLDTVRAELRITDRAEDENLARWIRQASGVVAEYCNRVFARETVSETFRLATRESDLLLSRYPVVSIASVVENGETLTATDCEVKCENGVLTRLRDDSPTCWPPGKIVVTYTAGYVLLTDLPYGIERAAILLVNQYRYAAERDPQLRSESTEGAGSSSYFDGLEAGGMSPEVRGLLAEHRKPAGS